MIDHAEVIYPLSGRRIFVAGHLGMVGSALMRRLAREDCHQLVERWFATNRPDTVFVSAATVGGKATQREFCSTFVSLSDTAQGP